MFTPDYENVLRITLESVVSEYDQCQDAAPQACQYVYQNCVYTTTILNRFVRPPPERTKAAVVSGRRRPTCGKRTACYFDTTARQGHTPGWMGDVHSLAVTRPLFPAAAGVRLTSRRRRPGGPLFGYFRIIAVTQCVPKISKSVLKLRCTGFWEAIFWAEQL